MSLDSQLSHYRTMLNDYRLAIYSFNDPLESIKTQYCRLRSSLSDSKQTMSLLIYYQSFIQAFLSTLRDDHTEETLKYQILKQQLVALERQFSKSVFEQGLEKHASEIAKMKQTYGRALFEKKRSEQFEQFHQMILAQKITREYDALDRLCAEKAAIEGQVQRELVVKRNEARQRIDRLRIMVQRMQAQI